MATIDVGSAATNRSSYRAMGQTNLDCTNPANDTGVLDVFELWFAATCTDNVIVGTFQDNGSASFTSIDSENLGSVTSGSKQTFTGKNCTVNSGNIIGCFFATNGQIERDTSGGDGIYTIPNNQFGTGAQTYTLLTADALSLYATGATAAVGNPYYYYLQQ